MYLLFFKLVYKKAPGRACVFFLLYTFFAYAENETILTAPKLTNNPSLDVIVTNSRPLLSFFNASGGIGKRTYTIQIDTNPTFTSKNLITYKNVHEENKYITGKREISHRLIEKKDSLKSKTTYYWRVRVLDEAGNKGPWAKSRFFFDAEADDSFMNLIRIFLHSLNQFINFL